MNIPVAAIIKNSSGKSVPSDSVKWYSKDNGRKKISVKKIYTGCLIRNGTANKIRGTMAKIASSVQIDNIKKNRKGSSQDANNLLW